jgi:RNA polymerase sigma-70 factor (ECF subfamily)
MYTLSPRRQIDTHPVRRQGTNHHDAQDLTQAFFGKLLEKNYLGDVSRDKGRFRTFLLASLKHFFANDQAALGGRIHGDSIVSSHSFHTCRTL